MYRFIFAILLSVFIFSATAFANPFTVAGVYVDAEGDNAIAAQTTALSEGQRRAAQIIVQRVTAEDTAGLDINAEDAARMMRAMEIADEKRTSSRYYGTITVAFNPAAVRAYAEGKGFTYVASQASSRIVIPMMGGQIVESGDWYDAWASGIGQNSLTPLSVIAPPQRLSSYISSADARSGNMDKLAAFGRAQGVSGLVVADAREQGGKYVVKVTEYSLDTRDGNSLGTVSGFTPIDAVGAVSSTLETRWKRELTQNRGPARDMVVSILYDNLNEWQSLQSAINGSTLIKSARLDALSKDGALMTLTIQGEPSALADELRFKGVTFEERPKIGPVMRIARR